MLHDGCCICTHLQTTAILHWQTLKRRDDNSPLHCVLMTRASSTGELAAFMTRVVVGSVLMLQIPTSLLDNY
jgi:hypothetical protein